MHGDYGIVEQVVLVEDVNQPMYNLTVDEVHTFAVGDGEWVVHNCGGGQMPLPGPDFEPPSSNLLPREGVVNRYGSLTRGNPSGSGLEAHHMPSESYMKNLLQNNPSYNWNVRNGIAMNMESGRHTLTRTYGGRNVIPGVTPRDELARDIWNVREIYRRQGLYDSYIRQQLREVIRMNEMTWSGLF